MTVLGGFDERFDHALIVVGLIPRFFQLSDPKAVAGFVRIAAQVTEILHQHKSGIVLTIVELSICDHLGQYFAAPLPVIVEIVDLALARRRIGPNFSQDK